MYSRRNFLKLSGATAASLVFPSYLAQAAPHGAGSNTLQPANYVQGYLEALDRPHLAPLNTELYDAGAGRSVGAIVYDMTNEKLIASLQSEAPLPIASAFKAAVLMFFVDTVDPEVWSSVPIQYWGTNDINEVPERYHEAWRTHQGVLSDLYWMIVISDNPATGRALGYVAQQADRTDPLVMFNDWSHDRVGISQLSAVDFWRFGIPGHMSQQDARYMSRDANVAFVTVKYANIMTPRDLGLYYVWMLEALSPTQQTVCLDLLSVINNERRGNVERLAYNNGGTSFSKNGTLGLEDSPAGIVITDAGIVQDGDNKVYLVVVLSVDGDRDAIPNIFGFADDVIKGRYQDKIDDIQLAYAVEENHNAYFEHRLQTYYPNQPDPSTDKLNYAFVRYEGVKAYYQPSLDAEIRNPVISTSRFGVHLLMQGAAIRFVPLDDEWVQHVPDNPQDNVQSRLAGSLYLRREDLWMISPEYVQPIPYLVNPETRPVDKFIIINLGERELVMMEGGTLAFKTPIATNPTYTPVGTYPIIHKWFARSMQAWAPGVPFTSFFHVEGYAIHAAPWQRWEATVTQDNIKDRTSAGCINCPDWITTVGDYTRPVDELIFRWQGGLTQSDELIIERPGDHASLRVIVVDRWDDIYNYSLPAAVYQTGARWDDIYEQVTTTPVFAPDSYRT